MLTEKFEIFLALLAGLILLVMGILLEMALPAILLRLLIVLAAFYAIGLIVKTYLRKRIFFEAAKEQEPAEEGAAADDGAINSEENAENQPTA
ncbi:MAG: hypothetical protein LBE55_06065 [Clostridiales bacterium]|jgi:hypothetical protein|nr:hypothetical protein [Clostridiales bacterium]